MADMSRRGFLVAAGAGVAGTIAAWPRLTAADVPGRGEDVLRVALIGTSQDAEGRKAIVDAFQAKFPEIRVQVQPIQAADWSQFFAKVLTMVAAGTPPDVCYVATEGVQLFADRLGEPLDRFVTRDKAEMQEYFTDVHPSLIEAGMYEGSLYQIPIDFNAANVFYNAGAFQKAGVERPPDNWSTDDFLAVARKVQQADRDIRPFFWTNRLWGGVVPWLYINDTSFLTESKAPGGEWLWDTFYPDERGRGGGYRWLHSNAQDPRVLESFELLRELVGEGLASSPAQGGGSELVGLFSGGRIAMTPAGGFWAQGLHDGGMKPTDFDVAFFPRMRSQRHQYGAAGNMILKTSKRKDAAWEWVKFNASKEAMQLALPAPITTPTRRSMVNAAFYAETGPQHWQVFYDTLDKFPTTGPIPAPPQQAAVETALIKNVTAAVTGDPKKALATLDRDLTTALKT